MAGWKRRLDDLRRRHRAVEASAPLCRPMVCRTIRLIHAQPGSFPGIDSAAARARCGATTLKQAFTEDTGIPLGRYALEQRVIEACRLLDHYPDLSIGEVAWHCGYAETTTLARVFHRVLGVTPSDARRSMAPIPARRWPAVRLEGT